LSLTLERFYILKPNGKYRPIGAPTLPSSLISKAFTDMTYFISEQYLKPFQHGFRRKHGTQTAIKKL